MKLLLGHSFLVYAAAFVLSGCVGADTDWSEPVEVPVSHLAPPLVTLEADCAIIQASRGEIDSELRQFGTGEARSALEVLRGLDVDAEVRLLRQADRGVSRIVTPLELGRHAMQLDFAISALLRRGRANVVDKVSQAAVRLIYIQHTTPGNRSMRASFPDGTVFFQQVYSDT